MFNGGIVINIFLCEDDKNQRQKFNRIIKKIAKEKNIILDVKISTDNPNDIIKHLQDNETVGVYFLDVDLNKDINGIELASKIREYDSIGVVIFITAHLEMSYLTFLYKVEAMDYIYKGDINTLEKRMEECILKAKKKFDKEKNKESISIKVYDKIINIDYDEILFFETSHNMHKIILHGAKRQIEFYGKLKDMEKELSEDFYRCHKSFIVNKNYIKEIDTKEKLIHLKNGERCLIASKLVSKLIKEII
ncbi:response regulator transcription factor [Clostridium senegalense]|uniref:Stage 0 sporulation protein A homolog n=1 Tax=Clostridium senegalense TaxID=1465809 RepID=A0A6M0H0M5_9CLOT|nr:response regulator transcription factor [Clostridium senegalense]